MVKITKTGYVLYGTLIVLLFTMIFGCTRKDKAPEAKSRNIEQERIVLSVDQAVNQDPKQIIVANVNGVNISMAALIREMNRISSHYLKQDGLSSPELDKKIKDDALKNVIFRELVLEEAHRQSLAVDPARIDKIIKQIKAQMDTPGGFKDYLRARGVTEAELRQEIERSHLFEMIIGKEVYASIIVDERMLKEKYEREKQLFVTPGDASSRRDFNEVKDLLERMVKAEQGLEKMKQWEKTLRDKAVIRTVLASSTK